MSDDKTVNAVDQQQALDSQPLDQSKVDQDQQSAVTELSQESTDKLSIKLRVYSPFNDYFEGDVFSLTAQSATGPFDILPKHHNFISLLEPCELTLRTLKQGEKRINISGGLIHVKANQVTIFLDV